MRLVRIAHAGGARYGRIEGDGIELLTGPAWAGGAPAGERVPLAGARLLAPCEPGKVVGVARNYAEHARELGNEPPRSPHFFLKPPTAVAGPGDAIVLPRASAEVHHEAELGVVIGARLRRADRGAALRAIAGFTCVNDVTARDIQRAEQHFTRSKGFDGFCPVGPWIVPGLDPADLVVACRVNGGERQRGRTRDMIFDVAAILTDVSAVMTLEPGDLVATGTPPGVGPLARGDVVEVEVEGIGILRNTVVDEE